MIPIWVSPKYSYLSPLGRNLLKLDTLILDLELDFDSDCLSLDLEVDLELDLNWEFGIVIGFRCYFIYVNSFRVNESPTWGHT